MLLTRRPPSVTEARTLTVRLRRRQFVRRWREYLTLNSGLYVPLAGCILLAVALLLLGWPTAGALVAGLGFVYAGAWVALALREDSQRR